MTLDQRIGGTIRALRHTNGINGRDLAQTMRERGFTTWQASTVTLVEQGARPIRLTEAIALAELLRVTVQDLT